MVATRKGPWKCQEYGHEWVAAERWGYKRVRRVCARCGAASIEPVEATK